MRYCPECAAAVPDDATVCPTCNAAIASAPAQAEATLTAPSFDTDALAVELRTSLAPQYQVLRLLGVGGMGAVFLAREPALKRLVVVKVLAPFLASDRTARARFEREATSAAALSHPNVVRVYAVGATTTQHLPYIVMQYVQGETLADRMRAAGRMTERDARRILGEIAAALAAAHQRDFVHRDVKPGNVLLEGDSGRAYVADFGVSAALSPVGGTTDSTLTAAGTVVGTPIYMSPEQGLGEPLTAKSDVYSLGVLAYELVTGELPFSASTTLGLVAAHMRDTPTPVQTKRPDLSPEILRLIDRCLAKNPADRPSAAEVARGMLPSLESEIEWPPPGLERLPARTKALQQTLGFAAAGAILFVFMIAFTPAILRVHPYWLTRFALIEDLEGATAVTRGETGETSFFAWQVGLMLGGAALGVGLLTALGLAGRLTHRLQHYRQLGWRWSTLLDVAVDRDGRSGLMLAGAREFASLAPNARMRILQARRRQALFTAATFLWVIVAVALWLLRVLVAGGAPTAPQPIAGTSTLLVMLIPALVLAGAATVFTRTERELLGTLVRPQRSEITRREITEWYKSVPGAPQPVGPEVTAGFHGWWRPLGLSIAGVSGIILVLWASAALLASVEAARFVLRVAPNAATVVRALQQLADVSPYEESESVWRDLLPRSVPLEESTAKALLTAASHPLYDSVPLRLYDSDSSMAVAVARALRQALPNDTIQLLQRFGEQARTVAFRRLALADSLDVWGAALDQPVDRYGNAAAVPIAPLGGYRAAAHANALSAVAALARGDRQGFERRVGENAAFAEKLVREPVYFYNLVGVRILQRDVIGLLLGRASAEGRRDDVARLRQASERLQTQFTSLRTLRGMAGLAADPGLLGDYRGLLADPDLLPGLKAELLVSGWAGVCSNPWEILAGPTAARRQAMRAAAALSGIPHGSDIALLLERTWNTPVSAVLSAHDYHDREWLEHTPLATGVRLVLCNQKW